MKVVLFCGGLGLRIRDVDGRFRSPWYRSDTARFFGTL